MICKICGKGFELGEGLSFCPNCGNRMEEERYGCPWEEREKHGFMEAFFLTWKNSVFSPRNFYRGVPPEGSIWNALFYAMVVGSIGMSIQLIWEYIFRAMEVPIMMSSQQFLYLMGGKMLLILIILSPILVAMLAFITSGIYHVCLLIVGGANRSFKTTFKAISYGSGTGLFSIVPIFGQLVALVWGFVVAVVGLREMHKTTTGKVVIAIMLPLILCFCLGVVSVFIVLLMMSGRMSP